MSATAALSAAAVADLAAGGPRRSRRSPPVLAIATGVVALLAGLLRLGFLANFISEPVLKGFIVGLALTIIIGQVPEAVRRREGRAATSSSKLWDLLAQPRRHARRCTLRRRRSARSRVVLGLRRFAPVVPGSLVAVLLGIVAVELFDLDARRRDRRPHRQRPAVGRPARRARLHDYLRRSPRAASGSCSSGSPRASARPRPTPPATTTRSTPTASCSASAPPTSAPGCRAAWSSTAACPRPRSTARPAPASQLSGLVVAVLTVVTLLFLTGLFEELPEATLAAVVIAAVIELVDIAGAACGSTACTRRRLGQHLRPSPRGRTSSPPSPRCSACSSSTRCPGLFIGIVVSLLLLLYRASRPARRRARPRARAAGQYGRRRARTRRRSRRPGVARPARRGRAVLRQRRRASAARDRAPRAADGVHGRRARRRDDPVRRRHRGADARRARRATSPRGVRLLVARDVGQVRDVLGDENQRIYPTVEAAVTQAR